MNDITKTVIKERLSYEKSSLQSIKQHINILKDDLIKEFNLQDETIKTIKLLEKDLQE